MALAQILVVDDSFQWRGIVSTLFDTKNCHKIIGVAENGLEAIHKVNELRPDLTLMDISLPELNGIEATRQICKSNADSKIEFVSMLADSAIVEAAFDVGGSGYILKHDFSQDFCTGIKALLEGRQFLSRSLTRDSGPPDIDGQCGIQIQRPAARRNNFSGVRTRRLPRFLRITPSLSHLLISGWRFTE